MDYINRTQLDDLLLKNENINLYFEKLSIVFNYQLQDTAGNEVDKHTVQEAFKLKIDGKDMIVTIDSYKDYEPFYMVLPADSPEIIEVKSTTPEVYSVNQERIRVSEIAKKKLGGWIKGREYARAFNQNTELNNQFEKEVNELIETYIDRYSKTFISKMGENIKLNQLFEGNLTDTDIHKQAQNIVFKNNLYLLNLSGTFEKGLEEIYKPLLKIYEDEMHGIKKTALDKAKEKIEQARPVQEDTAKAEKLKAFVEVQNAKDFSIDKFGYYPTVNFTDTNVIISFVNKDEVVLDTLALPLKDVEIDYVDKKNNDPEYLYLKSFDESSLDAINKDTYKKYYHALHDLKSSLILKSESDLPYFDYVIENLDYLLPESEDHLFENDKYGLLKLMKNNYSNEVRLEYVNKEIKQKFSGSTKLKP